MNVHADLYLQMFSLALFGISWIKSKLSWLIWIGCVGIVLSVICFWLFTPNNVTVEIDFGGTRKDCTTEKGWFSSSNFCVEQEMKRKMTVTGSKKDVEAAVASLGGYVNFNAISSDSFLQGKPQVQHSRVKLISS